MRIIDRYIIREIAVPFGLGLAVFTLILLIARILRLIELVVSRGVPFVDVVKLFSYILPSFLEVTVPMALLLAVLVGLGRLSSDSEIVALRSCGIGLRQIARPIGIVAIAGFGLAVLLSLYARPWGNGLLRDGLFEIAKTRASAGIQPGIFNADFAGLVLYVAEVEPPGNVLQGILISGDLSRDAKTDAAAAGNLERTAVAAKAGVLIANERERKLTLRLYEGSVHSLNHDGSKYHRTDFGSYDLTLDLDTALADLQQRERSPQEILTRELRQRIAAAATGDSVLEERIEMARRYSVPFACLGFAAVAIPLGIRPSRGARSRSFALSIGLILGYYLLLTLGESLAARQVLPPLAALALPNLGLALLAGLLMRRSAREGNTGNNGFPELGEAVRSLGARWREARARRS